MIFNTWQQFADQHAFRRGNHDVYAIDSGGKARPLLRLCFDQDDSDGTRHLPCLVIHSGLGPFDKSLVCSALVRAGVKHPGLRDEDLRDLHRDARREHHIELFADLNAVSTGLLRHIVDSLGSLVARVIVSSSSIDVLHEYQGRLAKASAKGGDFLRRAEMARALRQLEEMQRIVPVHIHQLPPGASRYFARSNASPMRNRPSDDAAQQEELSSSHPEDLTFISEDRQMIAAFWDYKTTTNPRLPIRLVTSDFSLAHVCAAERVPLLFARSPYEIWKDLDTTSDGNDEASVQKNSRSQAPASPETLWVDPFAPAIRFCAAHTILWELCLVFARLNVALDGLTESGASFELKYDRRSHLPGELEEILKDERGSRTAVQREREEDRNKAPRGQKRQTGGVVASPADEARNTVTLALSSILDVLPRSVYDRTTLSWFKPTDKKALEELELVGEVTELYHVLDGKIEAGSALPSLIDSLESRDYIAVNDIFRRFSPYDRVLREAEKTNMLPSSRSGGAATGWAVLLGAAYKTTTGALYGLAEVSMDEFAEAVRMVHAERGGGQAAVSLPEVLDGVCRALRISPIRFEAMLSATLGHGYLRAYEVQRATVNLELPEHRVVVAPTAAEIGRFLRPLSPGRGVVVGGTLISSLVRRGGSL